MDGHWRESDQAFCRSYESRLVFYTEEGRGGGAQGSLEEKGSPVAQPALMACPTVPLHSLLGAHA